MPRLTDQAFSILQLELQATAKDDLANQVQRELVLRRLEKLRIQEGTPLTYEEMRETIVDLLPNFNDKALRAAAKVNRASSSWKGIKVSAIALFALMGGIGIANLPIPGLRWAVAQTAPVLLVPSFMSMDDHYRKAIASVEQADQLVNQATSAADFELGSTKIKDAQQHLAALPVWFVGYYPSRYCEWFGCSWRFTRDEFRAARENVARMEAKLFQEGNARTQLEQENQALAEAQQAYKQGKSNAERSKAIAQWQAAIDALAQIPSETLAGRTAQGQLEAAQRDFQQVVGFTAANTQTNNLMEAAKQFAIAASKSGSAPHSLAELKEIKGLWTSAIERIEGITVQDANYLEAQKQLVRYRSALGKVEIQMQAEQEAVQAFESAQQSTQTLLALVTNDPQGVDRGRVARQLQEIIDELKKVKKGTTVYSEAQNLMKSAQNRLK